MKSNLAGLDSHRNGCYLNTDIINHIPFQSYQCDFPSQQPPRPSGGCTANPAILLWKRSAIRVITRALTDAEDQLQGQQGYKALERASQKPRLGLHQFTAFTGFSPLFREAGVRAPFLSQQHGTETMFVFSTYIIWNVSHNTFLAWRQAKTLGSTRNGWRPSWTHWDKTGGLSISGTCNIFSHRPLTKTMLHSRERGTWENWRDTKKHMNSSEYGLLNKH